MPGEGAAVSGSLSGCFLRVAAVLAFGAFVAILSLVYLVWGPDDETLSGDMGRSDQ